MGTSVRTLEVRNLGDRRNSLLALIVRSFSTEAVDITPVGTLIRGRSSTT